MCGSMSNYTENDVTKVQNVLPFKCFCLSAVERSQTLARSGKKSFSGLQGMYSRPLKALVSEL
jgi:hypothetical protein